MFEFHPSKVATVRNDVLSGLTVALALVPEAVAFAFVAGVHPLVGLYAAFLVGLITALIGGSGSGKTTITDLVSGLLRPDAGVVAIDGVPLEQIDLAAWRSMIGYVPQELVLLHDSVRTNVTFGDPRVSDAEVEAALTALLAVPAVLAQSVGEEFTVGDIRIEGLQRISEGTVYNYLRVNIGDNLDVRRQQEAIRDFAVPE